MCLPIPTSSTSFETRESLHSSGINEMCCCQCRRPVVSGSDTAIGSGLLASGCSETATDDVAQSRIAEMEAELMRLRHQLAMLVMAQENSILYSGERKQLHSMCLCEFELWKMSVLAGVFHHSLHAFLGWDVI